MLNLRDNMNTVRVEVRNNVCGDLRLIFDCKKQASADYIPTAEEKTSGASGKQVRHRRLPLGAAWHGGAIHEFGEGRYSCN